MDVLKKYCEDVLTKKITTGELIKLAVKRYMRDLTKQNTNNFPYYFDEKIAMKYIRFFQICRHWKGEKAGQRIELEPHQIFYFANIYGWRQSANGRRRFHTVMKTVGRKTYKTTEAAVMGASHLILDNVAGAQVYAGATKYEQALIVVNDCGKIIQKTPELISEFKLFKYRDKINRVVTTDMSSMFGALGQDEGTQDGFDPSMGIIDEYHAHPNDGIYNIIESGMGNRPEWLMVVITTAGANKYGPCYSVARKSGINTLKGVQVDENSFYLMFEMDETDDWNDSELWIKANPNIPYSEKLETYLLPRYTKAKNYGGEKETDFKTKNLNLWVDQYDTWISDDIWMLNDKGGDIDQLRGRECYAGLDLASTRDFNSMVLLFPNDDGTFDMLPFFWIPRDQAENRTEKLDINVNQWVKQGYIKICGTHTIDRDLQVRDIKEICDTYRVQSIGMDPAMSTEVNPKIDINVGGFVKTTMFSQGIITMSYPTKELEKLTHDRRLNHYGNPVLRWMISNVAIYKDANENIKIVKHKSTDKVDGAVASVISIGEYLTAYLQPSAESVYETRGVLEI